MELEITGESGRSMKLSWLPGLFVLFSFGTGRAAGDCFFTAADVEAKNKKDCPAEISPWKNAPGLKNAQIVVQFFEFGKNGNTKARLRVSVFAIDSRSKKLKLIAKMKNDLALNIGEIVGTVDLGPYQISETEAAFGVKVKSEMELPSGEAYTSERLHLFRIARESVVDMLETELANAGRAGKNKNWQALPQVTATLELTKEKTRGYFEFKKIVGAKSAPIRWSGDRYTLIGDDPLAPYPKRVKDAKAPKKRRGDED